MLGARTAGRLEPKRAYRDSGGADGVLRSATSTSLVVVQESVVPAGGTGRTCAAHPRVPAMLDVARRPEVRRAHVFEVRQFLHPLRAQEVLVLQFARCLRGHPDFNYTFLILLGSAAYQIGVAGADRLASVAEQAAAASRVVSARPLASTWRRRPRARLPLFDLLRAGPGDRPRRPGADCSDRHQPGGLLGAAGRGFRTPCRGGRSRPRRLGRLVGLDGAPDAAATLA